jgi:hypothetical protein
MPEVGPLIDWVIPGENIAATMIVFDVALPHAVTTTQEYVPDAAAVYEEEVAPVITLPSIIH